jgi:hypothetical protein
MKRTQPDDKWTNVASWDPPLNAWSFKGPSQLDVCIVRHYYNDVSDNPTHRRFARLLLGGIWLLPKHCANVRFLLLSDEATVVARESHCHTFMFRYQTE